MKKKKKTSSLNPRKPYIWVIAYITDKYLHRVDKEVALSGLDIQVFVPTVRILDKEVKGKKQYVFKPILFNYGFVKMPFRYACSKEKLNKVKESVTAIYGFFRDPSMTLNIPKKIISDVDGKVIEIPRDMVGRFRLEDNLAIVSGREVLRMLKEAQVNSIFNAEKAALKVGYSITLSGPTYKGMVGEILELKEDVVKVKLDLFAFAKHMIVEIDYGSIFYSIYRDYNPNKLISNTSLDEIESREDRIIDKIFATLA